MSSEAKEQPAAKIKVGSVQMAIWRNQGEHGTYYSASVQLSYKDLDGKWMNNGSSYGLRDVLNLAKAAMNSNILPSALHLKILERQLRLKKMTLSPLKFLS